MMQPSLFEIIGAAPDDAPGMDAPERPAHRAASVPLPAPAKAVSPFRDFAWHDVWAVCGHAVGPKDASFPTSRSWERFVTRSAQTGGLLLYLEDGPEENTTDPVAQDDLPA